MAEDMSAEGLFDKIRDWSGKDSVQQVFMDGFSKNRTAADTAIFEAMELLSACQKHLKAEAAAVAREREACAKLATEYPAISSNEYWVTSAIAKAIRHRAAALGAGAQIRGRMMTGIEPLIAEEWKQRAEAAQARAKRLERDKKSLREERDEYALEITRLNERIADLEAAKAKLAKAREKADD